ncbi:hypothetical protein FGO68_gene10131 [Halteria grandinella]|uniref:Uncharacterized protein n=1 Tax=Halteria grandinella TaxID=5974 RepID=A0A8J8NWB2_HALGN|nr:hypothetical protein FGO68_gene10131 [Halteria grandinella]
MSKNITFMIMGFACFSKDAIKLLGYASRQGRQCLVTQYQTFKIYVSKSREKLYIRSIYQLLDQKLHSRRYRLCYNIQDDTEQQELCESIEHLRGRLEFDSFKITQFDNFTQCILIESLSFLQKVSISGKYCSQAHLLQLLTMLPHSVQSFELIRYNFTKKISTNYKRLIKNLKLKKIHGDQFSYVYSLFTVTDTLKVDMKFLNEDNSESKLCQFKCKEIIIETNSLENEKLKALISNVQ